MPIRRPKGPDIRDVKPTTIIMETTMKIDGGSLAGSEIGKVWAAVHRAFESAAAECGLNFAWMGEVGCVTPERMARMVKQRGLAVEAPQAVGVDGGASGDAHA